MIDKAPEGPHAFIQWKGTDVCADLFCSCGYHGHVDEEFMYYYECLGCGKVYEVGSHVKLHELPDEEAKKIRDGNICLKRDNLHEAKDGFTGERKT